MRGLVSVELAEYEYQAQAVTLQLIYPEAPQNNLSKSNSIISFTLDLQKLSQTLGFVQWLSQDKHLYKYFWDYGI